MNFIDDTQDNFFEKYSDLVKEHEALKIAYQKNNAGKLKAEKLVEQYGELVSLFIKHSPIHAYIKQVSDEESKVLFASDNFVDMVGISGSDMVGKNMIEIFPEELAKKITADDLDVVNNGNLLKFYEDFNNKNYHTMKFPINLGDKKLLAGYTIDITEQKQVENARQESDRKLNTIIEQISDALIIYDEDGKIIIWNKSAERITGLKADYTLNKNIADIQYELAPPHYKNMELINQIVSGLLSLDSAETFNFMIDNELINSEKRVKIIQSVVFPINLGGYDLFATVFNDITELKDIERQLRDLIETKDNLFAIIAHDLRSPLYSLNALITLFNEFYDECTKEEVKVNLNNIKKSTDNVLSLLEDLLLWARVQTKEIKPFPENDILIDIINKEIKNLEIELETKNITIDLKIDEDTVVFIDKDMLGVIVKNLLSNAIKFSYEGGRIVISGGMVKDMFRLSFIDNGIGIKETDKSKLFRMDIKHSTFGTLNEKGTGLGLGICKELIERNQGYIYYESEYQKGSIFAIDIVCEQ